jgi:CO dehydrogenase maturation factor
MKIAVTGKGGVGKTFIAGSLASAFAEAGCQVIAIDADPSPNLGLTLGLSIDEASRIVPIAEDEELIRLKTGTTYSGVFKLTFSVDDIIQSHSVPTPSGVNLMVMGTVRAMGSGCTCPAHSVVKALLRHLVVERDEVVILDMDAGIEHLGRGTAEHVDILLIATDANRKSLDVAKTIYRLAKESAIPRVGLIGNRVASEAQMDAITSYAATHGIPVLAMIPFDQAVADAGITGEGIDSVKSPALRQIASFATALRETGIPQRQASKIREKHP